jgi:hypothetical protein
MIVMEMQWDELTPEQYDEVRDVVNWENDAPTGGVFHVASFDGGQLRVNDVWESAEDFQRFIDDRLTPGVQKVGITSEPRVVIRPAYRIFSPLMTPSARS